MNDEMERALDAYLISLIQAGSHEAFERLARRWTPKLLRYSSRVLGRPEAARDVVQETWMAAMRGFKRLDDPARFSAWIYSIAHRKCVDGIRFNQRQRRLIEGVGREATLASEVNRSCSVPEDVTDLAAAIAKLSQEQRDVVHLFYGEDLSVDDVASVLGVPAGTVKSRLHHAREFLKNHSGE